MTAISPTPAGEGKTTTTVGLGDALNRIGKKALICLREPSLGPVFGMKGGAAGGGYAQVVPMEDINLHFTGDFNAIQLANNLLAAMLDNHIHHGNELDIDVRRITWKRVLDMNDRALRDIVVSLGGPANGFPREDGFDIVVASEVMAIFCLATSLPDLKERLGNIVVGYTRERNSRCVPEISGARRHDRIAEGCDQSESGADAENNPAFIHGGPFANIAHGCNSVIATSAALKLADYVVTEAGFGADLGAEKFVDIKCRKSGLRPDAAVIVATVRALKYHGGADLKRLDQEDLDALDKGMANLERHVRNVRSVYGLPCVVCINHFTNDTQAELDLIRDRMAAESTRVVVAKHWAQGGRAQKIWPAKWSGSSTRRTTIFISSTTMICRCGKRSRRSPPRCTMPPTSPPTTRCGSRSPSCKTKVTAAIRFASPRRNIRFPPIRPCGALRLATRSTSVKCDCAPGRSSW